jgi:transcriptional regulator with XRE-family HTH domain
MEGTMALMQRPYVNDLAEFLAREIERRGLSTRAASTRSGLSHGTVNNTINTGRASYETLVKLADGLNLPREELLRLGGFSSCAEDAEQSELPPGVKTLIQEYAALDEERQSILLGIAQSMRQRKPR